MSSGTTDPMRVGIVAAFSKDEAGELAQEVVAWLEQRGVETVPETELTEHASEQVDAIIVLGGDGLMMRAAKAYPDTPLLGINFGKVGFLALVERKDWEYALESLVTGNFRVEDTATLAASIERQGKTVDQEWAINDVVIRSDIRMIDIEAYLDGHFVNTYPGDGMIVATSRGSTAYGMAAGGPILTSGVRGFALVPISCHSPIRTPMVVGEEQEIDLLFSSRNEAFLIIDGKQCAEMEMEDVVRVRKGEHQFRLITLDTTNFYQAFQSKFNYRIRPDAEPTLRDGESLKSAGPA